MIKAPKWAKGAHPTIRGWERNGEVLLSRKHTEAQLKEYYDAEAKAFEEKNAPKKKAAPKRRRKSKKVNEVTNNEKSKMLTEAPVGNVSASKMTASQIKALEAQYETKIDDEKETLNEDGDNKDD